MIFKLKDNTNLLGTHKTEQRFAWLPVRVGQKIIWLETYYSEYQFDAVYTDGPYVNYKWNEVMRWLKS